MADKLFIENAKVTDKGVELKTSNTGKDYAQFTAMWSSSRKNQQTGDREYGPTKFVTVRVFGFTAKDVAASIQPGDRVNVAGNIEHFEWQSQNGPKDDWSIFAESVTLPVPRAQQGGGNNTFNQGGQFAQQPQGGFGGQPQQGQGDPWNSAPPAPQQGGFGQEPPLPRGEWKAVEREYRAAMDERNGRL